MSEKYVYELGIDVETKHKRKLITRLRSLKTTVMVEDGGEYREDRHISQVHIDTTWNESQLDDWLYRTKGIEYIGTFMRHVF